MSLLIAGLDDYLLSVLPSRDRVLARIEEDAARRRIPIVGPAVGRLLAQYVHLTGARRVFELGSAIGYSTIWLARAVGESGQVFWTDASEENAAEARRNLEEAGVADRVALLVGDALASLDATEGEFDLVFNDVDKEGYPDVLRRAVPRLRVGGLLVTDNVLWDGALRLPACEDDAETAAIREFNRLCYERPDLETTILPLRDGVSVVRRIR
ncbi:MAG TPA: O-methyltransferase [Thermoanaerobaculia bacterium]|nr:O-methyltransferase [Thermoanaerobaculia bacterium]